LLALPRTSLLWNRSPTEAELARREDREYESASVLLDKIIREGRDSDQEQKFLYSNNCR
jgi:hypothetical protein